jgi:xanthine dehydrogenase accessory factor
LFGAPPKPRVAIFGAGPVGLAWAAQFRLLPFNVEHYDSREAMAGTGAVILPPEDLVEIAGCLEAEDFALIAAGSHELDYAIARAVLARDSMRYCGMLGSRKKRAEFEARFAQDGLTGEQIGRLSCPVGIASIRGSAPEVIAVATAAQVLEVLEASEPAG